MIKVKCYGGPAHGKTIRVDSPQVRFEVFGTPSIDRPRLVSARYAYRMPPVCSRLITNTYYLQSYKQEGRTLYGSVVRRHILVAVLDGADLLKRELWELEDAMENMPWTWSQDPSILHQFEVWWEKALHDIGWEKARVDY